jgi:hypothetical protein
VWRAAHERFFLPRVRDGKGCYVLYLGDHDPSGIDMSRDIQSRLDLFTRRENAVEVVRLALNMDQVQQYSPPPNPTKLTDSRSTGYLEQFGRECWELDALDPTVISELVREAVLLRRSETRWRRSLRREEEARDNLRKVGAHWESVTEHVNALEE